jgi:hypothetical protein
MHGKLFMTVLPALLENYFRFCSVRSRFRTEKSIDISDGSLSPMILLPLGDFLKKNAQKCSLPKAGCLDFFVSGAKGGFDKDCRILELPAGKGNAEGLMEAFFEACGNGLAFGGENAFKYVTNEIVTNIYEHSGFTHAYLMAQEQPGFVDLCFYDDGVSIPGSFKRRGMNFSSDVEAIAEAVNGLSTKGGTERGYGLWTALNLSKSGLKAECAVVSASGALSLSTATQAFHLPHGYAMDGTLIGARIPLSRTAVDIYGYLQ